MSSVSWVARPCPVAPLRGSTKLTSTWNRFWAQNAVDVGVQSGAAKRLPADAASGSSSAGSAARAADDVWSLKAVTSDWLPNWKGALWYAFVAPVAVSVRVSVYSTFESEPKKTQKWPLTPRASSTLTISSRLAGSKNQKEPVSPVSGRVLPVPVSPVKGFFQLTRAWKRPSCRQRISEPAAQVIDEYA